MLDRAVPLPSDIKSATQVDHDTSTSDRKTWRRCFNCVLATAAPQCLPHRRWTRPVGHAAEARTL